MRVLLVDDDEQVLRPIGLFLERRCQVSMATSVDSALALLDMMAFDVVVADLHLGDKRDGVWLLSEVARQQPAGKRILLTGSGGERLNTGKAVAHAVVLKPVAMSELAEVVLG